MTEASIDPAAPSEAAGQPPAEAAAPPERGPWSALHNFESSVNLAFLILMVLLPIGEILLRPLSVAIPGMLQYVSLLTMWVGFSGAMLAARDGSHLSLGAADSLLKGRFGGALRWLAVIVAALTTFVLAYGGYLAAMAERGVTEVIPPGIPVWVTRLAMPIGYGFVAIRLVLYKVKGWRARLASFVVLAALLLLLSQADVELAEQLLLPGLAVVLLATALGAPIYVVLGAAALLLFWADDEPIAAVAAETVRQISNPTIPTIPLFTFTGYLLAESKASERLVRVFRAWFGWLPGGMAIMTAAVCAFFTTFTGASGVTILALGGLLYPVLVKERYGEGFSVGLLTASGSIGLLFPPSLPIILYGVVAHVPIDQLFVAGLLPGLVLVLAVSALGVLAGVTRKVERPPFVLSEALSSLWSAKWELLLPWIVVVGIFSGLASLVEAAALTAAYALFVEVVIYRDLSLRDLVRVGRDCAALVGGVLIILGVAMGLTSYLVDAEVPDLVLQWVQGNIESKWVFLLALNGLLLLVGCLMDIFSALVVVVPLILPIAEHFQISPIHLGIVFLANLELGFLTPPVGMNLFLSSFRFKQPLTRVYRVALPFLLILIVAVLLITYVPEISLAPVRWVFGALPEAPPIQF